MKYLIVCPERIGKDNVIVYWKPNHCGYTRKKEEAGRYSEEEVDRICSQPFVDDFGIPETEENFDYESYRRNKVMKGLRLRRYKMISDD